MKKVLLHTNCPNLETPYVGKVRDNYDISDKYRIIVTTDRISAFDVVLPNGIPDKGRILTEISVFWFEKLEDIFPSHFLSHYVDAFPLKCLEYQDQLAGRSMWVIKAVPEKVECIVRGYVTGSGWKDYKENGAICGIKLPEGLVESQQLPEPIFTPSTKEEKGHDQNITFGKMCEIVGEEKAMLMREVSLALYNKAVTHAKSRGIIIADTKFEFGTAPDGRLIIIDEVLTPDSSRFWSVQTYEPGRSQDSYDKQIVRDYLLTLDWDKTPPGPALPDDIVQKTVKRYQEILKILTD